MDELLGYWLYKRDNMRFPPSTFIMFGEGNVFWAGSLQDDYTRGIYEIDKTKENSWDIIASDPDDGGLLEFRYNCITNTLQQCLSDEETGYRGPGIIDFIKLSNEAFCNEVVKHLCRIPSVGRANAAELIDNNILFVIDIVKWSDDYIQQKANESEFSLEFLTTLRRNARKV